LGIPLPFTGEFEVVIMIEVVDRRDAWVGLSSWPENDYKRAYGWKGNTIHESEMALFFECVQ